jgi:hypothetical protein
MRIRRDSHFAERARPRPVAATQRVRTMTSRDVRSSSSLIGALMYATPSPFCAHPKSRTAMWPAHLRKMAPPQTPYRALMELPVKVERVITDLV